MDVESVLSFRNIDKSFSGIKALDNVSFDIKRGEVHALLGPNGSGKSTLMKILLGLYRADAGEIYFKGEKVKFRHPSEALGCGISMIHQEISLIPTVSVAENIWLGREKNFSKYGILNPKKRKKSTEELLNVLGLNIDPMALVKNLSVANMQLVEIARAVSYNADLIIMDEPTSALAEKEVELLYEIIRSLTSRGISVIFITHKLEEVYAVCDSVTILRDGNHINTQRCSDITQDELVKLIIGHSINTDYRRSDANVRDVVFEVKGLCSGNRFRNVSFTVRSGEVLGFCGLMGAGRTEVARSIFGIDKYDSGEMLLEGTQIKFNSPKEAIRAGFGMVTEDRLNMGILPQLSLRKNMTISSLMMFLNRCKLIHQKKEEKECMRMMELMNVKASSQNQSINTLSGGNQQKVLLGRWLFQKSKVLILDEPTRGIDVGAKSEIYQHINRLAQQGLAIIVISSEINEILGISNRIIVMRDGEIVSEYDRRDVNKDILMKASFGILD